MVKFIICPLSNISYALESNARIKKYSVRSSGHLTMILAGQILPATTILSWFWSCLRRFLCMFAPVSLSFLRVEIAGYLA